MKKTILFAIVLIVLSSCASTKQTVIHDYNSTIELDSINVREIALQDAYEVFGYPDTLLVQK
jgi:hypothetical protein